MLSCFSHVQLCVTLWAVACQEPLSMRFSRQEYWSGFPCPPPGDLPDTGIKPEFLRSPALAGVKIYSTGPTGKTLRQHRLSFWLQWEALPWSRHLRYLRRQWKPHQPQEPRSELPLRTEKSASCLLFWNMDYSGTNSKKSGEEKRCHSVKITELVKLQNDLSQNNLSLYTLCFKLRCW